MNASKENCKKALDNFHFQEGLMNEDAFKFIKEFLEAAYRKLPYDATVERNKKHKKKPKNEIT